MADSTKLNKAGLNKVWLKVMELIQSLTGNVDRTKGTLQEQIDVKATSEDYGRVKVTNSSAVTDSTGLALAATEKNASIDGTLAKQINELNSNLDEIAPKNIDSEFLSSDIVTNNNLYGFISNNVLHLNGWIEIPAGTYNNNTEIFKINHTIGKTNTYLIACGAGEDFEAVLFYILNSTNIVKTRNTFTLESAKRLYFLPVSISLK